MVVISFGHASGSMSFDDLKVTVAEEGERDLSLGKSLFNGMDFSGWNIPMNSANTGPSLTE